MLPGLVYLELMNSIDHIFIDFYLVVILTWQNVLVVYPNTFQVGHLQYGVLAWRVEASVNSGID
jgi:hypothetical protein